MPARRKCWYVYILSSLSGTLYVGLTDNLRMRLMQHKEGVFDGFTKKYQVNRLMYFEVLLDPRVAANREKQIKKYRREKKIALFTPTNPEWKDLSDEASTPLKRGWL
jgi:putative endonuclease